MEEVMGSNVSGLVRVDYEVDRAKLRAVPAPIGPGFCKGSYVGAFLLLGFPGLGNGLACLFAAFFHCPFRIIRQSDFLSGLQIDPIPNLGQMIKADSLTWTGDRPSPHPGPL